MSHCGRIRFMNVANWPVFAPTSRTVLILRSCSHRKRFLGIRLASIPKPARARLTSVFTTRAARLSRRHPRLRPGRTSSGSRVFWSERGLAMPLVPFNRALQTLAKVDAGSKGEFLLSPACIELASRLTIGLARVPSHPAAKMSQLSDQAHEVADADFESRSEVDRIGLVITLGGKHDAFGGVLDI